MIMVIRERRGGGGGEGGYDDDDAVNYTSTLLQGMLKTDLSGIRLITRAARGHEGSVLA